MKTLFILRGVPGCGKSTLAKSLCPDVICEADNFFYNENGEYCFDFTKLHQAHGHCRQTCENAMISGVERIVVSNTSTSEKEFAPYRYMAEHYGYQCFVIVVENRHGGVNSHGVPEDKLDAMRKRLMGSIKL